MPFGEVMYRCNAHYCFSSVFRNRVVGLVITLALMQLFLFSFYLNGLHSQVVVTAGGAVVANNNNNPVSSSSTSVEEEKRVDLRSGSVGQVGPQAAGQQQQDAFLNPSISKARAAVGGAAKKALDRLMMAKKKPAIDDLMALAAKKFQDADPQDPMAKLGFNLIANAINNVKNQQPVFQQQETTSLKTSDNQSAPAPLSVLNDVEDQTNKSQYANLAQLGLQMLTNGLAVDPSATNKAGQQQQDSSAKVLEMASQLMWQSAKLSSKAGFDPQMAKSALAILKNAVASQKIDPKIMLTLASKMMQSQSADQSAGFNLLSQLLSNGQLASALLNTQTTTQPVSPAQSKIIYTNYVKITSKKLPKLVSKMSSPYSSPSSKVVVDIGFHYTLDKIKACRANASYLVVSISSAANTEERQAARETWIKDLHQLIGDQVDIVFLIGQTANVTVQRAVEQESIIYGDLIQTNVQEPVENAVFKTLAALVWIEQNCPDIQQILKMDDDVYISAGRMLKAIKEGKATPTITGSLIDNLNPHTTSDGRHKTSKKSWPLKEFPRFILGGAYLLGRPAVPRLLAAAQVTPILPLEDVYVTGLCATGGKVELIPNKSLFEEQISEELDTCTFVDFASWRSTGPADVKQTWNFAQAMKKSGEVCVTTNKCARTFMGICIPSTT